MTMPDLGTQTLPAASTIAIPQGLAERTQLLAANGHSWMSPDTQVTLAAAPTSDNELLSIANDIKNTLAGAWNGYQHTYADPVLQKQPTTSLALARYLSASLGPLPIRQDHLPTIQQNLQKLGFGKDLAANGVWDSGWNSAYNSWADALRQSQLSGNRPGSVSAHSAAHHWWDAVLPSHVINATVAFATSLPGALRSLAADSVGQAGQLFGDITHGDVLGAVGDVAKDVSPVGALDYAYQGASNQTGARAGAFVESIGRQKGPVTPEQYQQMHGLGRVIQDVGTILALVPVAGEGSAAARIAAGEFAKGISLDAAERGPGVVARSLFGGMRASQLETAGVTPMSDGLIDRTLFGGTTAGQREALLTQRNGIIPNLFQHVPLLRQVAPIVGKLADADGGYYQLRTSLAAPYINPSVRVAGREFQRLTLYGAALRSASNLANATGVGSPVTHDITEGHALDQVDMGLNRIIHSPLEHPFSGAIDSLALLLHGPTSGPEALSAGISNTAQGFMDHATDVLGHVNLRGAFEDGTGLKASQLEKAFGGPEYFNRFVTMKAADLAATHYAQDVAQREGLNFGDSAYLPRLRELKDQVWASPDVHTAAVQGLMSDWRYLSNRIRQDMVNAQMDPKAYASDAVAWMRAGDVATGMVKSGFAKYLFGPQGLAVVRAAQDHFDFGGDLETPAVRVSGMTRRDYTGTVTDLYARVARQVDQARVQLGRDVADAEQSGNPQAAVQARARQGQLEEALTAGNMDRFASTMKKAPSTVRNQHAAWDRLGKDTQRLRTLIAPALHPDQPFNLNDVLRSGVGRMSTFDPDSLYTRLNGPPQAIPGEIGSSDWMREQLPVKAGAFGVARVDSKTAQTAARDVNVFRAALDAATTPREAQSVMAAMKNYAHVHFGMDESTLGVFDQRPDRLAQVLEDRAHDLASDVFLPADAPVEARAMVAQMKELGYKPVLGTHIGHLWDGSLPSMPEVDGHITVQRKIVNALGVNPEQIDPRTAGQRARLNILDELNQTAKDARYVAPPRTTPDTIMALLDARKPDLPWAQNVAYALTRRFHQPGIEQLARDKGLTFEDAAREYKLEMAKSFQLRDIPRKEIVSILTTPHQVEGPAGTWTWQGMDAPSADLTYRAILRGYRRGPGMMGAQALEDWARAGFTVMDKAAVRFAGSDPVQAVAAWPNDLVRLRNTMRFNLSPMFDARRITKQNVKMALDGVEPVFNPLKEMVDGGYFTQAQKLLGKVLGEQDSAAFDEADRYLHAQSIWGLYNARHFEAYYAWQKKLGGANVDDIRTGIRKVFEYGSLQKSGRSPLERTLNTIWFPLSFEKTLIRNVGVYAVDHPAQALLASGIVDTYHQLNDNQQVHDWIRDHLPLVDYVNGKLNAFAHGLSLGQFGGINAPLLGMLLPQNWGSEFTTKNLKKLIPVWQDFGGVVKAVTDQAGIAKNAALNAIDYGSSLGARRDFWDPYRPTISPAAQRVKAEKMRAELITRFTPALDWNRAHASDTDKVKFPFDARLPASIQGEPVTRLTLGYIAQRWFPAYSPVDSAVYAQKQQGQVKAYLDGLKTSDPNRYQSYSVFVTQADRLTRMLQADRLDTATAAQVEEQFRTAAANVAETDPSFYKMYDTHYRWILGPLEQVTP